MLPVPVVEQDVSGLSATDLTAELDRTDVDFVVLRTGASVLTHSDLRRCVAGLDEDGSAVGLIATPEARDVAFIWKHLPPALASLVMRPSGRCPTAVRCQTVSELGFRDVTFPVWDFLMRAASNARATLLESNGTQPTDGDDTVLPPDSSLAPDIDGLPELAPNWPPRGMSWLADHLARLRMHDQLPGIESSIDATALHAGLWQVHDFLDESHDLAQSIQGQGVDANGDYWHAIMHRREPDYSNAKYWFRRVGPHPVFHKLATAAELILDGSASEAAATWKSKLGAPIEWNAPAFVDLCQSAATDADPALAQTARRIQWAEMLLLLAHCACQAMGSLLHSNAESQP